MKKLGLILAIGFGLGFTSCYQEPSPGTGTVIVLDANDFRVPSADVKLSQPGSLGTGYIVVEGITDASGEFDYTHAPALEVILDVSASFGTKVGQGSIRIKPNETSSEEVRIY